MKIRPVLRLTQRQCAQLMAYSAVYRSYLWQQVIPSPERNVAMRDIQALHGRLTKLSEQGLAEITLIITDEEQCTLKQLFTVVTKCYAATPTSEQRVQQLTDLTTLRFQIERTLQ